MLYNLGHKLAMAELSPLPDMHGTINAQATCTFTLSSAVLQDTHYNFLNCG